MAYTPSNLQVFTAAFSGSLSAFGASAPNGSRNPADSTLIQAGSAAMAFAQMLDTIWGGAVQPNLMDFQSLSVAVGLVLRDRGPFPVINGSYVSPTNWMAEAQAVIALVQAGDAIGQASGIQFPPIGGTPVAPVVPAQWGAPSARPIATASGKLYANSNFPLLSVDNPIAPLGWQDVIALPTFGTPPLAANAASIINLGIKNVGDALIGTSVQPSSSGQALWTWPNTIVPTSPWRITMACAVTFSLSSTYPDFGICVANGPTFGTNQAMFTGIYNYNSDVPAFGQWSVVLGTQTRNGGPFGSNDDTFQTRPFAFIRMVYDGAYWLGQYSTDYGATWTQKISTANPAYTFDAAGITHYGIDCGASNGTANIAKGSVFGYKLEAYTPLAVTGCIPNSPSAGIANFTVPNHGLSTGDFPFFSGVGGITGLNGLTLGRPLTVTGPNTFTVPVPGIGGAYTNGGICTPI